MTELDLDALKSRVLARLDELMPELIALSDEIFAHPELRFEERYAVQAIADVLARHDIQANVGVANLPTAFVASMPGHRSGPRLGLFAEYDALPEIGHACGHNLIGTASVGAFLALSAVADQLDGSVTLYGTPGEEGGAGKVIMLERDQFDGLDTVLMAHPTHNGTTVDTPFLASGSLNLKYYGKPAHAAAAPTQGINALDAVVMTYVGINGLRQRLPKDINIAGIITHGGSAVNVIPDYAELAYSIRAEKWQRAQEAIEQMVRVAEGCATSMGVRLEWTSTKNPEAEFGFYTEIKQNAALKDAVRRSLDQLDIPYVPYRPEMGTGSTDFANVSQEIPGLHLMLDLAGTDDRPPHTVEFARAAGSEHGRHWLRQAAAVLAVSAIDILNGDGVLDQVRQDHLSAAD